MHTHSVTTEPVRMKCMLRRIATKPEIIVDKDGGGGGNSDDYDTDLNEHALSFSFHS